MAAAAATAQAQAVQYASHFAALQNAIGSGNLKDARQALSVFQRDSAVASANGYDPVSQSLSTRQDFSALKKAVMIGDLRTAQTAFSSLKENMGLQQNGAKTPGAASAELQSLATAVSTGDIASAKKSLGEFGKKIALATSVASPSPALNPGGKTIQDIRSLQVSLSSGDPKKISTTFIKVEPELASFAQAPQVFPTSGDSFAKLSVTSSTQAVLQGIESTMLGAQPSRTGGTTFAPTPELILGSKGMTIPPGADIPFPKDSVLLKGLSVIN